MLQDVEDAMRDLGVSRAKLNRDLARTKEIITDETATLKEKLAAIETVRAAEKKQTDAELAAAKKRVEALRIEASQSEGVSDERRQKLSDAQAASTPTSVP
jgi:peptidoglycan hydrolase CwlO-like protein